jgi:hypothetical protein
VARPPHSSTAILQLQNCDAPVFPAIGISCVSDSRGEKIVAYDKVFEEEFGACKNFLLMGMTI